jgi:hypothetical protein
MFNYHPIQIYENDSLSDWIDLPSFRNEIAFVERNYEANSNSRTDIAR